MSEDEKKTERAVSPPKKRGKRGPTRTGELWAKCPECRMPVKDAELFKHLLNCPGADARQAEWKAQQAAAKQAQKTDPEAQAQ
jgi:acetyl-CoA carboxylase beta subunit